MTVMGLLDKFRKILDEPSKPVVNEGQSEQPPPSIMPPKIDDPVATGSEESDVIKQEQNLKTYNCEHCKTIIEKNQGFIPKYQCGKCGYENHYEDSDSLIVKFKKKPEIKETVKITFNPHEIIDSRSPNFDVSSHGLSSEKINNTNLKTYNCEHCKTIIEKNQGFIPKYQCGKCGYENHYEDSDSLIVKFKGEDERIAKEKEEKAKLEAEAKAKLEAQAKAIEAEVKARLEAKAKAKARLEAQAKSEYVETETERPEPVPMSTDAKKPHSSSNQGKKWTSDDHDHLKILYKNGVHPLEIAQLFDRTETAIIARIRQFELDRIFGIPLPPSSKQIEFIIKLGGDKIPETREEASDLIEKLLSEPSDEQLVELDRLGYDGPLPETKEEARELTMKHYPPRNDQLEELAQLNYSGKHPNNELEAHEEIQKLKSPSDAQLRFIEKNNWNGQSPSNRFEASKIITKIKSGNSQNQSRYHKNDNTSNDGEDDCPKCDGEGCDACDFQGTLEEFEKRDDEKCLNCQGNGCYSCNHKGTYAEYEFKRRQEWWNYEKGDFENN